MLRFKHKHTRILGILPKYSYRHMVRHRRTGSVRKVRCSRRGNTYKKNFSDFGETLSAGLDPPKSGHSKKIRGQRTEALQEATDPVERCRHVFSSISRNYSMGIWPDVQEFKSMTYAQPAGHLPGLTNERTRVIVGARKEALCRMHPVLSCTRCSIPSWTAMMSRASAPFVFCFTSARVTSILSAQKNPTQPHLIEELLKFGDLLLPLSNR